MKPILFSTPMVQALLAGRKTQTRRLVKDVPSENFIPAHAQSLITYGKIGFVNARIANPYDDVIEVNPKYIIGDILWVRETWQQMPDYQYVYKADFVERYEGWERNTTSGTERVEKWKPSIFMPREAARILLEVTAVRVQRLNDISEEDAIAEGIESFRPVPGDGPPETMYRHYLKDKWGPSPIHSFQTLWQSINGPDTWVANPWVCAYSFKQFEKPLGRIPSG